MENNSQEMNNFDALTRLLVLPDESFDTLSPYLDASLNELTKRAIYDKEVFEQIFPPDTTNLEDYSEISAKKMLESIDGLKDKLSENKRRFLKKVITSLQTVIKERTKLLSLPTLIHIELVNKNARIPEYANVGDSGMDVFATEDYTILPGETKLIPLGIKMVIPEGYEIQVRPRSGNSLKTKMRIANSPGTVDSSYRGELGVIVENVDNPIRGIQYHYNENQEIVIDYIDHGSPIEIIKGMKIAQLVLVKVEKAQIETVDSIAEYNTSRGEGGFGSTDNNNNK